MSEKMDLMSSVRLIMKRQKCSEAEAKRLLQDAIYSGKLPFMATDPDTGRRFKARIVNGEIREEAWQ